MKHVVQFSGGIQSWAAAKRVAAKRGTENLILLFADTKMEDEDLYRFIKEAAADVGGEFITIADGRTPWEVFFAEKMMGRSGVDLCSRILKRNLLDKWRKENTTPKGSTFYVGIGHKERKRLEGDPARGALGLQERFKPWIVQAPLCERPYRGKMQIMCDLKSAGMELPRLYKLGFSHNNCGGFCIKAGHAHFKNLLDKLPERYAYHEQQEKRFRRAISKNGYILRDRTGGAVTPLTLEDFRMRTEGATGEGVQADWFDQYDWSGCGCAID